MVFTVQITVQYNQDNPLKKLPMARKEIKQMKQLKNNTLLSSVIQDFELSVRSTNCLMNSELNTVTDLINCTKEELKKIKNLGKKSEEEILLLISELKSQTGRFLVVDESGTPLTFEVERPTFIGEDGNEYYDIAINESLFSVRGFNVLHRNGYDYVSQIRGFSFEELISFEKMGKGTAQLIVGVLEQLDLSKFEIAKSKKQMYDKELLKIAEPIAASLSLGLPKVIDILSDIKELYPHAASESLINLAYQNSTIRDLTKKRILSDMEYAGASFTIDSIKDKLPVFLNNTMIVEELFNELEFEQNIKVSPDKVEIKYPSLNEVVNQIVDPRTRLFIQMQLSGKTLQEIGDIENISRERARQIIAKSYKRFPKVEEDKYSYLCQTYNISKADFCSAFEEPESTYIYCNEKGKRKNNPLEDAIFDENLTVHQKKCIQKILDKDVIVIGGTRIFKRKNQLADYIVKTHCIERTRFSDFEKYYQEFVEENGLNAEDYMINYRTYSNRLAESNIALWNYDGKSFRYYDILSREYDQLFDELQLDQYHDVVISSYKLFSEHPKLMKEYGIEDEYELHNLLKKVVSPEINPEISFSRMPTIIFGNGNKEKQIYDLLLEHAPISGYDLADLYEKKYGEKAAGVMWNTMKYISQYNDHGIYRVDYEPLTSDEFDYLKNALIDDIYPISEVKHILIERFPSASAGKINTFTIRSLGFMHYPNYIIRNTYSSAANYFTEMLSANDVFTLTNKEYEYVGATFFEALYDLKKKRTIIEMLPSEYISIRKLISVGVSPDDLRDYCDKVNAFVRYGEYFTIHSIRKQGFTHPLDELGFEDWFYASILGEDERFSYRRLGKRKLLCNKSDNIEFADLITAIIESIKKINIFDLQKLLDETYGITTRIDKLITVIKSTYCYYDDIMETAYVDYDTYFEEV